MSEHNEAATNVTTPDAGRSGFRPGSVAAVPLATIAEVLGVAAPEGIQDGGVTGITLNSRAVEPGDLYMALPGASRHGADFVPQAVEAGAVAVVTDDAGARQLALAGEQPVPVLIIDQPRTAVGPLAALIYRSQPSEGGYPTLYGVTGTNGKTTTTYFINSLLRALGKKPGLIGTIEIVAGGKPIPSLLTTPESTDVHALLALMRERGLEAASMEVSSHAISFRRVDGVMFDVAGFTNLTQDHLDLHGSMEEYFRTKADLFTAGRARHAVVTVDDEWGRKLAELADIPVTTLSAKDSTAGADWQVARSPPAGSARNSNSARRRTRPARPHGSAWGLQRGQCSTGRHHGPGVRRRRRTLQGALDAHDPFTVVFPDECSWFLAEPAAVVDFAHNPDALARALEAVRSPTGGVPRHRGLRCHWPARSRQAAHHGRHCCALG